MSEAKGTYKEKTVYVWQIKHKSRYYYSDNIESESLAEVEDWANKHDSDTLKTRIIKRTIKEDIV